MTRSLQSLVVMVVGLWVSLQPLLAADESQSPIPQRLELQIGSFWGPIYRVSLVGDTLAYKAMRTGKDRKDLPEIQIKPTRAQWEEFAKSLDRLDVWKWQASYPSGSQDATQWSVEIVAGDHKITSSGNNIYPQTDGKPGKEGEPTTAFKDYLDAVGKLLGMKDFGSDRKTAYEMELLGLQPAGGPTGAPGRLKISVGSHFEGFMYEVEWEDGALHYLATPATTRGKKDEAVIKPTEAQWREFFKTLDDLGVWKWQSSYPSNWQDGTQWTADIVMGDHKVTSEGNNSYPESDAKPGKERDARPTKAFKAYLAAVEKLLGGKPFH